jgi:hypothetical protein
VQVQSASPKREPLKPMHLMRCPATRGGSGVGGKGARVLRRCKSYEGKSADAPCHDDRVIGFSSGWFLPVVHPKDRLTGLRSVPTKRESGSPSSGSVYQKCVKDAGSDQAKAVACESYLKAAEALK